MRVRVRLFGALAEQAGAGEETVDLAEPSTAGDVLRAVGDRHPTAAGLLGRISVAVNLEVVPAEHPVGEHDEVALLPPVAGGARRILAGLRQRPTLEEAMDAVADPDAGGTVVFVGTVRAEGGAVERLVYSAYREMAERVLHDIAEEGADKWDLAAVAVLHATGELAPGERTIVIACSAAHRGEAFDAARYLIDEVKRRAPVWKKESGPRGERWIGV